MSEIFTPEEVQQMHNVTPTAVQQQREAIQEMIVKKMEGFGFNPRPEMGKIDPDPNKVTIAANGTGINIFYENVLVFQVDANGVVTPKPFN